MTSDDVRTLPYAVPSNGMRSAPWVFGARGICERRGGHRRGTGRGCHRAARGVATRLRDGQPNTRYGEARSGFELHLHSNDTTASTGLGTRERRARSRHGASSWQLEFHRGNPHIDDVRHALWHIIWSTKTAGGVSHVARDRSGSPGIIDRCRPRLGGAYREVAVRRSSSLRNHLRPPFASHDRGPQPSGKRDRRRESSRYRASRRDVPILRSA